MDRARGGDAGWCVVVITQCQHSTHSPPHEQLLEELGVGGVPSTLSLIATTHPPCKQMLAVVVVVLVVVIIVCPSSLLIATTHPPCKQMLTAVVVVLVAIVVVLFVIHCRCR